MTFTRKRRLFIRCNDFHLSGRRVQLPLHRTLTGKLISFTRHMHQSHQRSKECGGFIRAPLIIKRTCRYCKQNDISVARREGAKQLLAVQYVYSYD